jgi:integrase
MDVRVSGLLNLIRNDYLLNARRSFDTFVVFHWKHVERILGGLHVHRLGARDLEAFKARRLEEGAARGSINLQLALLRRGLRLAQRLELVRKIPHVALLAGSTIREGFLTAEQFGRILATLEVLDPDAADVVAFLYSTGWRVGEATGLTWREVNDEAIHLSASRSKNGRPRTIPLEGPLRGILERRRELRSSGPYVFHRGGRRIRSFRGAWARACRVRGLAGALVHDLRRSFCRNALLAGVPQRIAMAIGGWTSPRVWARYAIVDEALIAEAMRRMARKTAP